MAIVSYRPVLIDKKKEEGRRKKEEGRRKKEEDIHGKFFRVPYFTFN
ncbi:MULTISPECIES: hypothetical protein [unclassified Microcoleus]